MATPHCTDCPSSCLGYEQSDLCIHHEGTGESLKSIIDRLDSQESQSVVQSTGLTSDDVASVGIVRNSSSLCASKIINRTFTWSLSNTSTTSTFSWKLTDVAANLPAGYQVATVRVRATGKSSSGNNVIADSRSLSAGLSLGLDKYPVTVDFLMRVTSECGNIDLEAKVMLTNPSQAGNYSATLVAEDLNPQTQQLDLTSHLNLIESNIFNIQTQLSSIDGNDLQTKVIQNESDIASVKEDLDDIGDSVISYVKDGATRSGSIEELVNDLYAEIKILRDAVNEQQATIATLQANS